VPIACHPESTSFLGKMIRIENDIKLNVILRHEESPEVLFMLILSLTEPQEMLLPTAVRDQHDDCSENLSLVVFNILEIFRKANNQITAY